MTKLEGFKFEYTERDPACLPKEYPATEGETCFFLDGYKHVGIDDDAEVQKHIDEAMHQINMELQN